MAWAFRRWIAARQPQQIRRYPKKSSLHRKANRLWFYLESRRGGGLTRIDEAWEQISEIHEHLAKSQMFRGYRAGPGALSGVPAMGATWVQPLIGTGADPWLFVLYWPLVAVAAFFISG